MIRPFLFFRADDDGDDVTDRIALPNWSLLLLQSTAPIIPAPKFALTCDVSADVSALSPWRGLACVKRLTRARMNPLPAPPMSILRTGRRLATTTMFDPPLMPKSLAASLYSFARSATDLIHIGAVRAWQDVVTFKQS